MKDVNGTERKEGTDRTTDSFHVLMSIALASELSGRLDDKQATFFMADKV